MSARDADAPSAGGIAWSGVEWTCAGALHRDFLAVPRDASPEGTIALPPIVREPARIRTIPRSDFACSDARGHPSPPVAGRFYPPRCLPAADLAHPFRVLRVELESMVIDGNDPWAGLARQTVAETWPGVSLPLRMPGARDIPDRLARSGCALQAVSRGPDDEPPGATRRADESPDRRFYASPRLVHHVDAHARTVLAEAHRRQLTHAGVHGDAPVLDLMSGFATHLPDNAWRAVTGLGLNAEELAANPALSARLVADLNARPILPFADASFAAVLCALSVEYLTDPIAVFREVGRVLAPDGVFVVSWSDRWFPTKSIAVWGDLHPYERVARIVRQLLACGTFTAIETESRRGLARPADDRYAGRLAESDPIYVVAARRS